MKTQISIYRHEVKYYISKIQAAELRLFLKSNLYMDPHGDETGSYWIRSQYFDTLGNKDYYEKIIGHNARKKIRLRIYNINTAVVRLEIKNKFNGYTLKESVNISNEDARKLVRGDYSPLLGYKENAANKVYAYMLGDFYRQRLLQIMKGRHIFIRFKISV